MFAQHVPGWFGYVRNPPEITMSVHKTVELMGSSTKSWEDAVQKVTTQAAKSIKGIKSVWVKDMSADVDSKGKLKSYKVNCKVTFEVK